MSGGGTPTPLRLVVASANRDKVKEIVSVLSEALDVELVPRPGDLEPWAEAKRVKVRVRNVQQVRRYFMACPRVTNYEDYTSARRQAAQSYF